MSVRDGKPPGEAVCELEAHRGKRLCAACRGAGTCLWPEPVAAPESGRASRLRAWLDDVQISNRLVFPVYANPGELKADLCALLSDLDSLVEQNARQREALANIAEQERQRKGWPHG